MAEYAFIKGGQIVNVVVADAEFIAALPGLIADPTVDTGALDHETEVEITDLEPKPGIGWAYDGTTFTAPVVEAPAQAPETAPTEPAQAT